MSVTNWTQAGAHSAFVSYHNQYGILNGFSNLSGAVHAVNSGMRRVKGVETVPNPLVAPQRQRRVYDDGPGRTFTFAGNQIAQGDVAFGIGDIDLENAAQGSTSWTRGNWKKTIRGMSAPIFSSMVLLLHSQAYSEDSATNGAPGYWNTLYPDVQLLPMGHQQLQAAQTADVRYSTTINLFGKYIDGRDLDSTNFTSDDGMSISWWSAYPTLFQCFIGDNAQVDFVLDYTPVDAASTKVSKAVISGGVATVTDATVSSVTPATKTVTVSAAPADFAFVIVEYEALRLVA